ncbi:MAG: hypothetical protein AB1472_06940, partial [Candidatus Omnitrophota bacterium]
MKKLFLLILFSFLLINLSQAATLSELNRPLLSKNQWRLDVQNQTYYFKWKEEFYFHGVPNQTADFNYDYVYNNLSPEITYGITDKLQIGVGGS